MTYSNAIFFMNITSGDDSTRASKTPSAYANNGAGLVRVTTAAWATLATGAIVNIAGTTSAVYDGDWKINVISSTTFDLVGSTYSVNPATKGTVTPFGGCSWADAWKIPTGGGSVGTGGGARSGHIAPGDVIKIAKSPDPVKLSGATGQATWTSLSKTVTFAEAQTANICMCEADWTVVNATSAAKQAVATDAKEGAYCVKVVEDGTPGANQVQAYWATGDLTLSDYQAISFWIKLEPSAGIADANRWEINLCSNADGTGDVDVFPIPFINVSTTSGWIPLTITRNGGGNLGSSTIKSINISNGSSSPTASKYILLDDIIAVKVPGVNLCSVIGKNSLAQGGDEGWYGIQSINGTTCMLDGGTNCKGNAGQGYFTTGTSPETVDTYFRETIFASWAGYCYEPTTYIYDIQDSGIRGNNISFLGGYNTTDATGATCDGETILDGRNGIGYCIGDNGSAFITMDHISFFRYGSGLKSTSNTKDWTINNIHDANNCTYAGLNINGYGLNIGTIYHCDNSENGGLQFTAPGSTIERIFSTSNNNSIGASLGGDNLNIVSFERAANNKSNGISCSTMFGSHINRVGTLRLHYNTVPYIYFTTCYEVDAGIVEILGTLANAAAVRSFRGKVYADFTMSAGMVPYDNYESNNRSNSLVCCRNYNGTGYPAIFSEAGKVMAQAATAGGTGTEWKLFVDGQIRDILYPVILPVAKVAVSAGSLVTVKLYFKKSHGTAVGARLFCRVGQIAWAEGTDDIYTTAPTDTSRNEVTLTFTPSVSGVVEIEVWAYWISGLYGTPTAYANSAVEPGVNTKVTSAAHGLSDGDVVTIWSTASNQYDGTWTIENKTTDTFDIVKVYVTNPAQKGYWNVTQNVIVDDITVSQA